MSLSIVELSATDKDLLKKIIVLLEAQLRGSQVPGKFSDIDAKVVTGT